VTKRDWGLASLVIIAWGFNFVVIRWGLDGIPPFLLGTLRFLLVAFPAVFLVPRPQLHWKWVLAYGLTISFGQFALLFSAMYLGMPAGLASLVLQAQALFTLIFAAVILGEKLKIEQLIALIIAGLGMALLAMQGDSTSMTLIGFVLSLGAAACWAMGNIINRKIGQLGSVNLVSLVVWAALVPPIPFLMLSFWLEGPELIQQSLLGLGLSSLLTVFYLAFIATLFGYSVWAGLLSRYPAAQVAPLTLLVPVVGLACAAVLLDERISSQQFSGILLVMVGLLVNVFGGRLKKQKLPKQEQRMKSRVEDSLN